MNESIFTKLRIPTLLGLAIIIFGVAAGVYGVVRQQNTAIQVSAQEAPEHIVITNIGSDGITISWQTPQVALGYITYGRVSPSEQTALDDRDKKGTTKRRLHYVSLTGLSPDTDYQFKIFSGKFVSQQPLNFTTAGTTSQQNGFKPIIGNISQEEEPLVGGIVYLSADEMSDQSVLVGSFGTFIIPISLVRQRDLSNIFKPDSSIVGKLRVVSEDGQLATATFSFTKDSSPLGVLKMGTNVNFAITPEASSAPQPTSTSKIKYDLNSDGKLNASDYATLLNNLGRKPKDKRADLNNDGVVDQKDLKLMQDEIDRLSTIRS